MMHYMKLVMFEVCISSRWALSSFSCWFKFMTEIRDVPGVCNQVYLKKEKENYTFVG